MTINLAHELFLLSTNLSQIKSKDLVIKLFVESINSIFNGHEFDWCLDEKVQAALKLEVCTRSKIYGCIFEKRENVFSNENHILLQNAVQLLAILLEKLEQEALLNDQKNHLNYLVDEKTKHLLRTQIELQEQKKEIENQNEEYRQLNEELLVAKEKSEESERKVKEQSEEIEKFFTYTIDLLCIANTDGIFLRLNKEWENCLGYSLNELEGKNFLDFVHPDDIQPTLDTVAQLDKQINVINFINRYRCKDGNYKIIEWKSYPYGNRIFAAARDITQKKQFEYELIKAKEKAEESEEKYKTMMSILPDGVVIHQNGIIVYANASTGKIMKAKHQNDLLNKNVIDFVHPEYRNMALDRIKQSIISDKPATLVEEMFIGLDGNPIPVLVTAVPFEFEEKPSMLTVFTDISSIKLIEKELIEAKRQVEISEEKFRLMIKNSNDAFVLINENGEQFYISDASARDTGFSIDELKGPIQNVIYPEDWETVLNAWAEVVSKKSEIIRVQYRHKHKYKDYIWYEAAAQNFLDNPKINAVVVNVRDITKIKETEAELIKAKEKAEESERLKTAFLQNMSHEIRTPMNAIVGFSNLLDKPDLPEEKKKSFASIIMSSSNQLLSIVSDILTISSIDTKQEKLSISPVRINDIVVDLISIFKQQASNQNISFYSRQQLNDKESEIYTDKTKITQILTNLIANALKFTHQGYVEFGYSLLPAPDLKQLNDEQQDIPFLQFYVKDTGIGIAKDQQENIFERFRQADLSISKKYGGTGLGLSISKGYVELLGGKIWVESELEKGATFYFTIPYNRVSHFDTSESINKSYNTKTTILIAEDEEYNFLFIEELLINLNLKLIHAKNGMETIKICQENNDISLILMDIKMPVMDGYTAALKIKEFRPDLPIIAQTAYALEHEIEKFSGNAFDDYLIKPIDQKELILKVKKYIKADKS